LDNKCQQITAVDYYFPSVESLDIKWKTGEKIKKVMLRELYAESSIWESSSIQNENFDLPSIIKDNKFNLISGTDYELVVQLDNPDLFQSEFSYPFSILLDEDESAEMKMLLEGL